MAVPTRSDVIAQVRADLAAEGATKVWIRRSFEAAVAVVLGGLLWAWYVVVDRVVRQYNPATATGAPQRDWGAIFQVPWSDPGTAAGTAVLTGNAGAIQPKGSIFTGPDGQEYTLDEETTLDGDEGGEGAAFPAVTAAGPGPDYNLPVGTPLTLVSPASGVDAASSVGTTGIVGGNDGDTVLTYRAKLLERLRRPGEIGHERDYVRWMKAASPSVARAWAYPRGRLGTEAGKVLGLFAVAGSDPIPSGGLVTTVQAYVDARRPGGSAPVVEAPTGHAVPLTLALPPDADTAANRDLVEEQLDAHFATLAPGETAANLDLRSAAARSALSVQFQAVDGGAGTDDAVPATNVTLLYRGTTTWSSWT